jgi:hypothetical protein
VGQTAGVQQGLAHLGRHVLAAALADNLAGARSRPSQAHVETGGGAFDRLARAVHGDGQSLSAESGIGSQVAKLRR